MGESERVLVCFRWLDEGADPTGGSPAGDLLLEALAGLGGELVAWGGDRSSYQFATEMVGEVVERVIALIDEADRYAVGISQRDLFFRGPAGQARAFGPALSVAEALATTAKLGELLIDPQLRPLREGELATIGSIPVMVGTERINGALVLPGICPPDSLRASSPSGQAIAPGLRGRAPNKPQSVPPPGADTAERVGEEHVLLSALLDPVAGVGEPPRESPLGGAGHALPGTRRYSSAPPPAHVHSSAPPRARSSRPPPKPAFVSEAPGAGRRLSVIEELRTGRTDSLEELMGAIGQDARKRGASERLNALFAISQGSKAAGLEQLASAARLAAARGGANECRAVLAHAMGLAIDGQTEQALLVGLSALARAREWDDSRGQRASASFLAQLAESAQEYAVSEAWQAVAMRYPLK